MGYIAKSQGFSLVKDEGCQASRRSARQAGRLADRVGEEGEEGGEATRRSSVGLCSGVPQGAVASLSYMSL